MRCFCFCVVIFCILDSYNSAEYRQERAVIKYYNPKYVSQAQLFTARRGRSHTYTTNGSFTNIHPWNNNVTLKIIYKVMAHDIDFTWNCPLCDILKMKWTVQYLQQFSDVPLKCPLQKGQHNFYNLIFPPKNFPFPLPKGDTILNLSVFVTKTQENIIDSAEHIRFA